MFSSVGEVPDMIKRYEKPLCCIAMGYLHISRLLVLQLRSPNYAKQGQDTYDHMRVLPGDEIRQRSTNVSLPMIYCT